MKHGCGAAILSTRCSNPGAHVWLSQLDLKEPQILLTQRGMTAPTFPGAWAFPGGLQDPNEPLATVAAREAYEEIGVKFYPEVKPFWEGVLPDRNVSYFLGGWAAPVILIVQPDEVSGFGWFSYEDALRLRLAFRYEEVIHFLMENNIR